jgi:dienelactone hydrolase
MHIFLLGLSMLLLAGASAFADTVTYRDGKTPLTGYLVKTDNSAAKPPGVVILPAWKGVDEHSKTSADKLAALGYDALVADIYGTGGQDLDMQQAMKLSGYYKEHFDAYQKRIRLALDELIRQGADPQRIAVIGYCFGGTGALEAARGNLPVLGVVSFHGGLAKDAARPNGPIKPKVLVLHGADDPHVSAESIAAFMDEMREGKADWQMIWYADAVHSFSDPNAGNDKSKGAAYNPVAALRSWEHMKLFLQELFVGAG